MLTTLKIAARGLTKPELPLFKIQPYIRAFHNWPQVASESSRETKTACGSMT